jgi:hypothetical protein
MPFMEVAHAKLLDLPGGSHYARRSGMHRFRAAGKTVVSGPKAIWLRGERGECVWNRVISRVRQSSPESRRGSAIGVENQLLTDTRSP